MAWFRMTCLDTIFAVLRYTMETVLETKDIVHVYACMGGWRYSDLGDKKMVNHRRNILEFSKSEIVLIQGFHRSTDTCPGVGLLDHMVALFWGHRLYLYSRTFSCTSDPPGWQESVVVRAFLDFRLKQGVLPPLPPVHRSPDSPAASWQEQG